MAKKKSEPAIITFEEFQVQLALGIFSKTSLATPYIRVTTDVRLIKWAMYQPSKQYQKAAVHNPLCPTVDLLYAVMFLGKKETSKSSYRYRHYNSDTTTTAAELALKALHKKPKKELQDIFELFKNFPQLSIMLGAE